MIQITDTVALDDREIKERFVRATGPGGQNVNKEATAVELRFDIGRSSLSADVKKRLIALAGRHVTTGVLFQRGAIESICHGDYLVALGAQFRFVHLLMAVAFDIEPFLRQVSWNCVDHLGPMLKKGTIPGTLVLNERIDVLALFIADGIGQRAR